MTERFGFGPYRFDPQSGELRHAERPEPVARLSPQPARLLALLAERAPEVVTREEIRSTIWKGVEVEFDSSLHFCVRQIRAALQENADRPRFIENLPRRGYRLLVPVRRETADRPSRHKPGTRGWVVALAGLVLLMIAGSAAFWIGAEPNGAVPAPAQAMRIGVYPFEPAGNLSPENLVVRLTADEGAAWAVVGPSSTSGPSTDGSLRDTIESLELDYVFHVREVQGQPPRRLLEWIRSDGAHVWVRYLDALPEDADPLLTVHAGLSDSVAGRTETER